MSGVVCTLYILHKVNFSVFVNYSLELFAFWCDRMHLSKLTTGTSHTQTHIKTKLSNTTLRLGWNENIIRMNIRINFLYRSFCSTTNKSECVLGCVSSNVWLLFVFARKSNGSGLIADMNVFWAGQTAWLMFMVIIILCRVVSISLTQMLVLYAIFYYIKF